MAKTKTENMNLEIEDENEFLSNEYINRNFQAIDKVFGNLISDETIAAAQAAGIDLTSGGGVLNLNRLVQLFLTNPVIEEYDQDGWHVREYVNGWVEQEGIINVNLTASDFSSSTGFYCRNATVGFPVAINTTKPRSVYGIDASGGASCVRALFQNSESLGVLTFCAAASSVAVTMPISLKVCGYKV